jgi:hypothetical protein
MGFVSPFGIISFLAGGRNPFLSDPRRTEAQASLAGFWKLAALVGPRLSSPPSDPLVIFTAVKELFLILNLSEIHGVTEAASDILEIAMELAIRLRRASMKA